MGWETVWDVRSISDIFSWVIVVPIIFTLLGAFFAAAGRKIIGGVVALFGLGFIVYLATEYLGHRQAIKNETYHFVEGIVEDFRPGREVNDPNLEGSHLESFIVNDVSFSYHHRNFCFCFNETNAVNGPVREGLYVRIWHVDKKIIRLEIKR